MGISRGFGMSYNIISRRRRCTTGAAEPPGCWRLTAVTESDSADFTVVINAGSGIDIDIDWGDGLGPVNYTTTGAKTKNYASAGTYYIEISGATTGGQILIGNTSATRARLAATKAIDGITGLKSFQSAFLGCTGLTSIPAALFKYNTAASSNAFAQTFLGCTGLTSIPAALFKYNTAASSNAFTQTFSGCTGLTSIPAALFKYNTAASSGAFVQTFLGCTGLTSVGEGLFRYNTAVGGFGFDSTFKDCNNLTLNPWIFYASGEESTRFASPVPVQSFGSCFSISSFTGSQGTAPALWDCTFNGAPESPDCFNGHSPSSVDNFGDIPEAWK